MQSQLKRQSYRNVASRSLITLCDSTMRVVPERLLVRHPALQCAKRAPALKPGSGADPRGGTGTPATRGARTPLGGHNHKAIAGRTASKGHMVQWHHIRFACGRPWAQIPVCPFVEDGRRTLQDAAALLLWLGRERKEFHREMPPAGPKK